MRLESRFSISVIRILEPCLSLRTHGPDAHPHVGPQPPDDGSDGAGVGASGSAGDSIKGRFPVPFHGFNQRRYGQRQQNYRPGQLQPVRDNLRRLSDDRCRLKPQGQVNGIHGKTCQNGADRNGDEVKLLSPFFPAHRAIP